MVFISLTRFSDTSFVTKASDPVSRAAAIWTASSARRNEYLPLNVPAALAMSAEISIKSKFRPYLRNSSNFLASSSFPDSIGFGRTSARVMTEVKACDLPARTASITSLAI